MSCGYQNLWYAKGAAEISKMLIIDIRNSCACLEENHGFLCLAPMRSCPHGALVPRLKSAEALTARLLSWRGFCGAEKKHGNKFWALVLIPKQFAHSFHSLSFVMGRSKTPSKRNVLEKSPLKSVKFRIKCHQSVYKPTEEKGGREEPFGSITSSFL